MILQKIIHCKRCGACCLKGGPVLHREDKQILRAGHIGYEHLVTIRKGEPAYDPVSGKLRPLRKELIKVVGKDGGWGCYFYDEQGNACRIYGRRFLECRLLNCRDTSELIRVIGRDTIIRADVINPGDPIISAIETHERECSGTETENLISAASSGKEKTRVFAKMADLVRRDTALRSHAIAELGLKAEYESFIFGRPLAKLLADRGYSFVPQVR